MSSSAATVASQRSAAWRAVWAPLAVVGNVVRKWAVPTVGSPGAVTVSWFTSPRVTERPYRVEPSGRYAE
ncbi:hypothetical protein TPA0905_26890 [Streptomyces olivaceus]|nr:hypothetical protein TPA0905_26890 [Streptomyces olivaceus]